jgi:hypothetical protein
MYMVQVDIQMGVIVVPLLTMLQLAHSRQTSKHLMDWIIQN